jgi:3'(2'), 5'-bisphosphate nucleotidase
LKEDLNNLMLIAIRAALLAGDEIMKVYSSDFSVENKSDNSPLTQADKNAHSAISDVLNETGLPVLSEEGKSIPYFERKDWSAFWMIDPLDGTKEFIKRNGEFTVNIALIKQQESVLGVIYCPETKVLYFGNRNIGSYKLEILNTLPETIDEILSISTVLPLNINPRSFKVVASRSHMSEETEMFIDGLRMNHKDLEFVSSGSSIKLCLVAEGSADIYPRFAPTMEWDTAAGQAICESSGKKVIDYKTNKPLLYNKQDLKNNWFIVK